MLKQQSFKMMVLVSAEFRDLLLVVLVESNMYMYKRKAGEWVLETWLHICMCVCVCLTLAVQAVKKDCGVGSKWSCYHQWFSLLGGDHVIVWSWHNWEFYKFTRFLLQ